MLKTDDLIFLRHFMLENFTCRLFKSGLHNVCFNTCMLSCEGLVLFNSLAHGLSSLASSADSQFSQLHHCLYILSIDVIRGMNVIFSWWLQDYIHRPIWWMNSLNWPQFLHCYCLCFELCWHFVHWVIECDCLIETHMIF